MKSIAVMRLSLTIRSCEGEGRYITRGLGRPGCCARAAARGCSSVLLEFCQLLQNHRFLDLGFLQTSAEFSIRLRRRLYRLKHLNPKADSLENCSEIVDFVRDWHGLTLDNEAGRSPAGP